MLIKMSAGLACVWHWVGVATYNILVSLLPSEQQTATFLLIIVTN